MKKIFRFRKIFKNTCFLVIFLVILIFQTNYQIINAITMENYQSKPVIEELRLKVPSEFKKEWLKAEKEIWDPWLSLKDGFLGRQLYWDEEREEALILVSWKNKGFWKDIKITDVEAVQEKFEDYIKTSLNVSENPFQLIFEGELEKQE